MQPTFNRTANTHTPIAYDPADAPNSENPAAVGLDSRETSSGEPLPAFASASGSTLSQFQHRHQGDVSTCFFKFEALPTSLKQYATENIARVQALAAKVATAAAPSDQNTAIREASLPELQLLERLCTASVTARQMSAIEIQTRHAGKQTAFPVDPERNMSGVIDMNRNFTSGPTYGSHARHVQVAGVVDSKEIKDAKALATYMDTQRPELARRIALWDSDVTTLQSLVGLPTVSEATRDLGLIELNERAILDQSQFVHKYIDGFSALPDHLQTYAKQNLKHVQALDEKLRTAAPTGQNEAIRNASIEDMQILSKLRKASVTAREMSIIEIEARNNGNPTAFPA